MEELLLLDNEEIFLLIGSGLNLLFTCSFSSFLYKVINGSLNYYQTPIIAICFCYINNMIWYFYSEYILHDLMKLCYLFSLIISLILISLYLIYEYKQDRFDVILNILLLVGASLAIHKLLTQVLNDEDKIKKVCGYSIFGLLCSILERIYMEMQSRSYNNLSFYVAISLILMSGCHFIYGVLYHENSFIIPNIIGVLVGFTYSILILIINNKYYTFQEIKGETVIDIDIKKEENEEQENNDKQLNENESSHLKKNKKKNKN